MIGAALVTLPALAFAIPISITNPTATFSNASPADHTNYSAVDGSTTNNQVRWGVPTPYNNANTGGEQSGLKFDVTPPPINGDTEVPFDLGTLTHFNFEVTIPTTSTTDLAFGFDIFGQTLNFGFSLGIDETPNGGNAANCAFQPVLTRSCPDQITFPNAFSTTSFEHDGLIYTLKLLGFGPDADHIQNGFITQEDQANTTDLWAVITTQRIGVPEPNGLLLMALGLLALGGTVQLRRKRAAKKA
ncbi:MAG TPA: THxN family PEP-CTERM protein [Rhodanobacteraceae bacterium]|nr:THxN family PEP-CTERM protein [Rhodanobacteraceae bacterium]